MRTSLCFFYSRSTKPSVAFNRLITLCQMHRYYWYWMFLVSSDWLVDRRHCNLKWQSAVQSIREKINAAIQDMPENEEIKRLLSGSCRSHYRSRLCLSSVSLHQSHRDKHAFFWKINTTRTIVFKLFPESSWTLLINLIKEIIILLSTNFIFSFTIRHLYFLSHVIYKVIISL